MRRVLFILASVLLGLLVLCSDVSAHASLENSSPANGSSLSVSPSEISLSFTEVVTPVESKFSLTSGGSSVGFDIYSKGSSLTIIPEGVLSGQSMLVWHVVSQDGHPVSGVLRFSVGNSEVPPSSQPSVASDDIPSRYFVRFTTALSMLLLAGAAMASRRKTALLAAAALFVSSLVSLFDSLVLYGFSLYAVGYSRFVTLSLMSSMLCAVLVFRKSFYFAAVVSVALFASQSFMYGHHIKTGLSSLFVAHVAHLLSAALWFSALVLLMLDKSRLLIASRLATLSAWVLVPSAVFMVVQYDVLPPDGVWEFIISAKILLVSLTLAAGALNHSRSRKTPCDVAAIRNLVKFEVASLSLVIMLSVALSGTSPTRHETTKTTPAVQVSLDKEFDDGTRSTVKVVNTDSGLEITLVFKNRALETVDSLSWSISDGSLVLEGDFLRMNDHFHAVVQSPPLKNQTLEISGVFDTFTPVSMVLDLEENDVKK